MALICTFSRSLIHPILYGFHTELAYSSCDLTRALNNKTKASSDKYIKFLLMIPALHKFYLLLRQCETALTLTRFTRYMQTICEYIGYLFADDAKFYRHILSDYIEKTAYNLSNVV